MFTFNFLEDASLVSNWLVWFAVLGGLFLFNEFARRWKWAGFFSFFILPLILTYVWFVPMKGIAYTDWFHLAKVYSALAGCIGFWLIRHVVKKDKDGNVVWRLVDNKWARAFPPLILALNICEAVARDIQVGFTYWMASSGPIAGEVTGVSGGIWNYLNAAAGIVNIFTITGWAGMSIRRQSAKDGSLDMIWPDMLWFWIIAYDLWNFAYTYNCIPTHSWYAGFALLLAPTLCSFTIGKGAWLQHRAQTLAIWCMFAQTFPLFQDSGKYMVTSTYNPTIYTAFASLALAFNVGVLIYMIYKIIRTRRNPYKAELYIDNPDYILVKSMAEIRK